MSTRLGVISAVGRPEYSYLAEAGASVAALRGIGIAVSWHVAVDLSAGTGVTLDAVTAVAESCMPAASVIAHRGIPGPGPTRNTALADVDTDVVAVLDSDDVLVPAGIAALVDALDADPSVAWAAGRCSHTDAELQVTWEGPEDRFAPGLISTADSFWEAKQRDGGIPFIANAALVRTAALRAVGGWPAGQRARAEDTATWAVLGRRYPGLWCPHLVYLYRRHPASLTMQPDFRSLREDLEGIAAMVTEGRVA